MRKIELRQGSFIRPVADPFVARSALTAPVDGVHHTGIEFEAAVIIAQTMAEYGLLNSIVAGLTAVRYHIETYIGSGNLKYVLFGALALIVLLLVRRSRRPRWH